MSKKIFIIEDDVNILSALQAQFSAKGMEVITNNGMGEIKGILQEMSKDRPDYIILDLILPQIDGFALLGAIKSKKEAVNTPVFIFTNLSDEDSRARCQRLGAEYYFIKSEFNIEEFVNKVEKILSNREKIKLK